MENIQNIFRYTIEFLDQMLIRYEYTNFNSGGIMLDVWYNDKFYVFQFEDYIGVSQIDDENIGFDTNPDKKFYNETEYKKELKRLFSPQ